ncbi:uncharacterized protein JCM10292_003357 [Rhodotorula paludigena]|uniref:uncharacterized protein n=1 Tax=Rhodotorula paludigena TaxID=86838 RepID=UPI0031704CE0
MEPFSSLGPVAWTSALPFAPLDDLTLPTPPAHILAAHAAASAPAPALLPNPDDPAEQIRVLRDMDRDADQALVANRAYQAELLKAMERMDRVRKRVSELQTMVESLSSDICKPSEHGEDVLLAPGMLEPVLPYFKYFYGKDLPPNEDGEARDRYLSTIRAHPWTSSERAKLKKEVVAQNHRLLATQAMRNGQDPEVLLSRTDPSWFLNNLDSLDWSQIALVMDRRTPAACRIQWTQRDHPLLNRSKKWTKDESERLARIVEERRADVEGGWDEVAKELGTKRPVSDVLRQWRRRPASTRDVWTADEDDKLREAVQLFGENWQSIARHVGRSAAQVQHRWTNSLCPTLSRGRWSPAEDALLVAAVGVYGTKNWREVARRTGGRTELQCRERWGNSVDPKLKGGKGWTDEEDATLLRMRDEEKLSWAEISAQGFDGARNDRHCLRRYTELTKKSDPTFVPKRVGRPKGVKNGEGTSKRARQAQEKKAAAGLGAEGEAGGGEEADEEAGEESEEAPPPVKKKRKTTKKKKVDGGKQAPTDAAAANGHDEGAAPVAGPSGTSNAMQVDEVRGDGAAGEEATTARKSGRARRVKA